MMENTTTQRRKIFFFFLLNLLIFSLLVGVVHTLSPTTQTTTMNRPNNVHFIQPQGVDVIKYPPMIIIGGMAQTKLSWEHHLSSLSKNRIVIIYECIGQGQGQEGNNNYDNVTLPYQAECILDFIIEQKNNDLLLLSDNDDNNNDIVGGVVVDLVGFSFGARVCMAVACLAKERSRSTTNNNINIRRMHLSGIAIDRSDYGYLAIKAWKDCLLNDVSLKSFAWSILMATYTSEFLRKQPLERYINAICNTNTREGLLALLDQSEISDKTNPWHVINMADRIITSSSFDDDDSSSNISIEGKLCVGSNDLMSPVKSAQELSTKLNYPLTIIPNCGHAVTIEGSRIWKNDVLEFLK